MPSERERSRLVDIQDNIRRIETWAGGMSLEQLITDTRTYFAVLRCLEIISEASRHLSDEVKERHSDIPWKRIADAGNFYRHDYRGVSERVVFATVRNELSALLTAVEAELAAPDQPSSP